MGADCATGCPPNAAGRSLAGHRPAAEHGASTTPPRSETMEVFKTHGAFSWSELLTTDPKKASEFYGKLFGWKIDVMPMPGGPADAPPYYLIKTAKGGDDAIGGLMACPQ